ncbi:hypothetical protein FEM48_Zijuj01G0178500 [Ziziphus jujuba var. spinosa]|uniref:BED-type domain-containing protein n=1 Tax=Ziziphus jujuba var. spinosa TaxID=714518 RepID=A0A978W2P7_ZIZJJ|nr:hypothetical protein FEM48_Zijuj01G0178500 [Ziziphus jujuba var. spinosa]
MHLILQHTTQPPQTTPASPISNLHQPSKPPSSTPASSLCLTSQPHLQTPSAIKASFLYPLLLLSASPASPISNLHQPSKPPSSTSCFFSKNKGEQVFESSLQILDERHALETTCHRFWINMDGLQINLESSSFEMPINLEDVASPMEGVTSGHKVKRKRKLTSKVWSYFDVLPLDVDGKQKCKCKDCGTIYLCDSKYGTENLVRHLKNCVKRDTRDIG